MKKTVRYIIEVDLLLSLTQILTKILSIILTATLTVGVFPTLECPNSLLTGVFLSSLL